MKIQYHNLYTHFIFITQNRLPYIPEKNRERIEKYITGIINNNHSKLYSIYANPEHIHFLASRAPRLSEETLATIVADSSSKFINDNKYCKFVMMTELLKDNKQSDHRIIMNFLHR